MTPCFAVYGAGGHCRVLVALLRQRGSDVYGVYDENYRPGETILGAPVLGRLADMLHQRERFDSVAIAIGDNTQRRTVHATLQQAGLHMPPLVHPEARLDLAVERGSASVVCIGAILGAQACIGVGALVNSGAILDHESQLGDFSHLTPGVRVGGRACIGAGVFVGMGAVIAQGVTVGDNAVVGANAVVLSDVAKSERVFGVHGTRIAR